MTTSHALLLAALRAAPRRYRLPPLPASAAAARAQGTDAALAWAIEAARSAREQRVAAADEAKAVFTAALAEFIRAALAIEGGDPAFQALVLQAREAAVQEYVQLAAGEATDRRALRAAIDAIAHPGKLRARGHGPLHDALSRLHALSSAEDWTALQGMLRCADFAREPGLRAAVDALQASPALQRLLRRDELLATAPVTRYRDLSAQRGPLAGTAAATQRGRASARTGASAERSTLEAFVRIAALLDAHEGARGAHQVVGRLRPPPGFPGAALQAKDEWDAAIVRMAPGCPAEILLLAEVKATPAAASSDFPRLLRGLQRLAQADPGEDYAFRCGEGELPLAGASLRALQPHGGALPANVIYCCGVDAEPRPAVLSAASKSVLGAQPASIAYALRFERGESPADAELASVWDALATAPRLRAVLHQDAATRQAREAMLHPLDLFESVAHCIQPEPGIP